MAGPGFQLGSFSTGLFSGAQNIFGLYKEYQGVKRQVERDAADARLKEAREEDERNRKAGTGARSIDGTQDFTRAPGQTTPTPASTPTSAPDERRPITPSDSASSAPEYPAAPMTEGDIAPSFRGQTYTPPQSDRTYSGGPPPPRLTSPTNMPTYDEQQGPPPPPGGMYGGLPRSAYPWSPNNPIGTQAINLNSGAASPVPGLRARSDAFDRAQAGRVAPEVAQPTPQPPYDSANDPGNRWRLENQARQQSSGAGGDVDAHEGVQGLPLNPNPIPITRTAPVDQPVPRPAQPGSYLPPFQRDPRDLSSPAIGGPAVQGGVPLAAAEPPSLGQRLLRSLNPMGSAQAAELPPPTSLAPPPSGQGQVTQTALPPARQPGQGDPNAPVNIPTIRDAASPSPTGAQPQGITPAQPPTAKTDVASHSAPAPLVVAGTGGKVTQSEATPPALAPPVDVSHYNIAKTRYPERLAMVERAIAAEHAEGIVSPEFMLATIGRENPKWDNSIDHGTGSDGHVSTAKGLVQIIDGTRRKIDPHGELDWRDPEQNIRLGVKLYKTQAIDQGLGSNTLQNAMVYRGGYDFLNGVAKHGFDGYAALGKEEKSQVVDMMRMFPGAKLADIPITAVSANHKQYDAMAGYQRAQAEGPDGLLRHLAETGPAGLGMSDRWRAYQSALETVILQSGHPEAVHMAAEWTAQMSQQGTVSNLIAADQAIMSGDAKTAIGYLAKAHAFFPDGTYARFGADNKGNIWAYQMTEAGGTPVGKPTMITHEGIAKQLIGLQNPVTYVKTLQAYQKDNAKIDLDKSHADYYKQLPGIKEEQVRAGIEKEQLRQQALSERAADAARHKAETDALKGESDRNLETEVGKLYDPANNVGKEAGEILVPEEQFARSADIYRQLRKRPSQGGGDMSQATAKMYADGLAAGKYEMQLLPTKEGKPPVYAVKDRQGKNVGTAPLTFEQGELIKPLLGLAGSAPLQAPGTTPAAPAPTPGITPARPPAPVNTNAPYVPEAVPMMSGLNRRPMTMAA